MCYCNFWELDTDHDFLLDKEDLIKLGNYSLTYRIVDRIFAGAPRPVSSGVPGKIGYLDFIWVLLSEEDKSSDTAIRCDQCSDPDSENVCKSMVQRTTSRNSLPVSILHSLPNLRADSPCLFSNRSPSLEMNMMDIGGMI